MSAVRVVRLETNSVPIIRLPQHAYHQYDEIIGQGDRGGSIPSKKKIQLMHHLQNTCAPAVFNPRLIYDGQKLAYCPRLLQFAAGNTSGTFHIHLNSPQPVAPNSKGSYKIMLTPTISELVRMSDLEDMSGKGKKITPRSLVATNLIQLIVRQGPNQHHHTNNGRAYFAGNEGGRRGDVQLTRRGIELWRGIFLSVRPTPDSKMILTVDTCAAAIFSAGALIDVCLAVLGVRDVSGLNLTEGSAAFKKLEKFLTGVRVTIENGNRRSRPKIIRGLCVKGGEFSFTKDGEPTNVANYFYSTYNRRIQFPRIIGVYLAPKRSERQNVAPAEVCQIERGQICKRIPDELRADMVKFSAIRPEERKKKILDEIRDYHSRSEYLQESGMAIEPRLITLDAKQLQPPPVEFGRGVRVNPSDGKWNVLNQKLYTAGALTSWAVVNFCVGSFTPDRYGKWMKDLASCCGNLGMAVAQPHAMIDGNAPNAERTLNGVMAEIQGRIQGFNKSRFIMIILLPQEAGPLRTRVKHWGDVVTGVATQCLREKKLEKANNQYWNNIALKLNARLGNCNMHASTTPFMMDVGKKLGPYMIMGADVGHPGPGVQKPSVVSVVYSHDMYASQYVALTGIQPPRQEYISDFGRYAEDAILSFGKKNPPPKNIIVFRDGVSEGEYENVAAQEYNELEAAIERIWTTKGLPKDSRPNVTFIVVTKRHHAVFFPNEPQISDRGGNCHPGIVVDKVITHPVVRDFYLQSHAAIQGTSRSSHYIVVRDNVFNGDLVAIQQLAFTLCHVYAKATRSVSIPAPVYYADLVCQRGMFHLDPQANLQFDDNASTSSGSSTFHLDAWQDAFRNVNPSLSKAMYFL